MTRIKISAAILCVLIITGTFSGIWINNSCESLIENVDTVSSYAQNGESEKALSEADRLYSEWSGFRKTASILVKNDKLAEIDRISSRIAFLIENESDELESELTELKSMLSLLKAAEIPVLTSVL